MPYNYAHALVGICSVNRCSINVAGLIDRCSDAFFIGTMGPDPYFGDALPRSLAHPCQSHLSNLLHSLDGRILFSALLDLAKESEIYSAYALGFVCHFVLDNHTHPYIEAYFPGRKHTPAEIAMDLYLVDRANEPRLYVPPNVFYETASLRQLDALHAALFERLFLLDTRGAFARAFRKWIRINALTFDPSGSKQKLLRFFPAAARYLVGRHEDAADALNLEHAPWAAPWAPDEIRTESFLDLFDEACAASSLLVNLAATAMESGDFSAVLSAIGRRSADAAPII
ncbi:MAG: zinc dependent phospholipase C family protein [Clostridia bacterium]